MTKRQAILLLFTGVLSKMAHADDKGNISSVMQWNTLKPQPMGITLNFDFITGITVTMGGKTVTVTSAELFKALSQ